MKDEVFESKWNQDLNAALDKFGSMPWADTYSRVAALILKGIKDNVLAIFPAHLEDNGGEIQDFLLAMAKNERSGENHTIMLTVPDDKYSMTVSMSLRKVVERIIADDELDGLVINPWTDAVFVLSKEFLTEAIELLETDVEEKPVEHTEKFRDDADAVYRIDTPRPMSRDSYKYAAAVVKSLRQESDAAVDIEFENFLNDDAIQSILIRRSGSKYHMELVNDMSDFGWDKPLVLAGDIDLNTTLSIIKRLGLNGEGSGDIYEIMHGFKSM